MQFSKCSYFVVECRFSNQWQRVARYPSKSMAQLRAKILSLETPFHAVRVCERAIPCNA